jgi:protein-tyrosine phosphatase
MTDYHCHFLPRIDDGAKDSEMSLHMLEMLRQQGVDRVIATPHFYAHREKSVARFIEKRKMSYERIISSAPDMKILTGAEVAIEYGIHELKDIEKLAIQGTDLILLEPPYSGFSDFVTEEINNISSEYGLTPVIAHIHRYLSLYSFSQVKELLNTKAIFQINVEAFNSFKEKRFAKRLINEGCRFVFGSDSHNCTVRRPNFDILKKKVKPELIEKSDSILEKHQI